MAIRPRPRAAGTRGFVVFGALVLVVAAVVAAVLLGKLVRYRYPDTHPARFEQRQLRYAAAPVEVHEGGRVTARLAPGDSAWTHTLESGDVVVFRGREGGAVLGIAPRGSLSPVRPAR